MAKTPTISLKHISANLAENYELSKKQTEAVLDTTVELIVKSLKKGSRIRLGGLGVLQVRKRAARMGRNPATGEPIKIKASKKVAFRPAQVLKEAIAGLPGDPTISHPKAVALPGEPTIPRPKGKSIGGK